MREVLLIGKFNRLFNELNKSLSNYFSIQLCSDNIELLKGMLQMRKPDVVLVSLNDLDDGYQELISYLIQDHARLPLVCIGTKNELADLEELSGSEKIKRITSPVMVKDVIDRIYNILGIPTLEDMWQQEQEAKKGRRKKTILLVDDAAVQLRAMEAILKNDYIIKMATSGKEALEAVKKERPDLILLDYDMPGCDGTETFELIQEEENGNEVPIVFVTGVNKKNRIVTALKLKPAGYLVKPVDRKELLEMARKLLED